MDWQTVWKQIVEWVFANWQMRTFGALLAVNLGLGLIAAVYKSDFKLYAIADFLKRALCYGGAYALIRLAALVEPTMDLVATAVWAFTVAAMLGHILANLKELGLPTGERLGRILDKE